MKPSPYRAGVAIAGVLLACICASAMGADKFVPIANPDFAQGGDGPADWKLSGGKGRWLDRNVLEVAGTGDDSNHWRCDYRFTPGALYHFTVTARQVDGSGSVVCGPAFANRDHRVSGEWKSYDHVFRVPDGVTGSYLRLGQWHATGSVQFDAVRLVPAMPVHRRFGDLVLGKGEAIRDGRYTFSGSFGHQGSNYHRTLHSATASFNSDRWVFGTGNQVTYRFALPRRQFRSARVSFNVNYHVRGGCTAEVSRDGRKWRSLVEQNGLGTATAALPADMFPSDAIYLPDDTIYVRLRSSSEGSLFQVNRIEFDAELQDPTPDATGETLYADLGGDLDELVFQQASIGRDKVSGWSILEVELANKSETHSWEASLGRDGPVIVQGNVPRGGSGRLKIRLPIQQPGKQEIIFDLVRLLPAKNAQSNPRRATIKLSATVAEYYRADYGERLVVDDEEVAVWWCNATHKVAPEREPPPSRQVRRGNLPAARLSAAKNDFEPVQIVLRPAQPLKELTAITGPLFGSNGATIPAENVQILRVAYHFVHHPTDKTGVRDFWPDALPPLKQPIDVPAGKNQPLWVLVHVPEDAKPGDYSGNVSLRAEGFSANVPIKLHVWDFALPKRNHIETAFGFSASNVFRYHGLKTDEDKRRVLDMYFQNFADHRISPYNPAPLDPIRVNFRPDADPPDAEVDFAAFDRAMTRAVEEYNFTGIRLPVQGMGGGTFHSRSEPSIGRFGENTPEYQAMFSSYVGQLEAHLREKGWLKLAYIYWFDEPAPKDYEFVAAGMNRLKKYAPGLQRMLTEEPGENLLSGTVDIWCPVSNNYHHEAAEKRRAHGERFWWYVCTGLKAPYCTLFIDHPATELRVWLWQTWQRKIVGNLVWSSNYWTSSAAFPDEPQNPYEDPMGYRSGYSTPRGVKAYWGNGDGRFIYPPEAAAVPGKSGPDPVIEPPVSSIRWEMLREGIEDYEMLYLLGELLAKRREGLSPEQIEKYESLLEVPESITTDMTTFTTDPTPIYARRAEVARAIEELSQ